MTATSASSLDSTTEPNSRQTPSALQLESSTGTIIVLSVVADKAIGEDSDLPTPILNLDMRSVVVLARGSASRTTNDMSKRFLLTLDLLPALALGTGDARARTGVVLDPLRTKSIAPLVLSSADDVAGSTTPVVDQIIIVWLHCCLSQTQQYRLCT